MTTNPETEKAPARPRGGPLRLLLVTRATDGVGEGTFAWLAGETGINRTTLSHIANGYRPTDEQRRLIAKAFQLDADKMEL